ncbi:uncharacterized protein LOC116558834 isoform X2 [Sapajus apella]|uniref:Uncharacterized protein LOC116558834 isoform X2 n=1 Tax=Sapajus apella TaxID=9515 RepID=A0A6J3IR11_SAPAP|nr:uncharacterized protein LOC116558834 isoform X2 [Sapajus apella]
MSTTVRQKPPPLWSFPWEVLASALGPASAAVFQRPRRREPWLDHPGPGAGPGASGRPAFPARSRRVQRGEVCGRRRLCTSRASPAEHGAAFLRAEQTAFPPRAAGRAGRGLSRWGPREGAARVLPGERRRESGGRRAGAPACPSGSAAGLPKDQVRAGPHPTLMLALVRVDCPLRCLAKGFME